MRIGSETRSADTPKRKAAGIAGGSEEAMKTQASLYHSVISGYA